jgi:hypothetical protein
MLEVVETLMHKHLLNWNSKFCVLFNFSIPLSQNGSPQNGNREVKDITVT